MQEQLSGFDSQSLKRDITVRFLRDAFFAFTRPIGFTFFTFCSSGPTHILGCLVSVWILDLSAAAGQRRALGSATQRSVVNSCDCSFGFGHQAERCFNVKIMNLLIGESQSHFGSKCCFAGSA